MGTLGLLVLFGGAYGLYFAFNMDVSVSTGAVSNLPAGFPQHVANLDLMNQRQMITIVSGFAVLIGIILLIASEFQNGAKKASEKEAKAAIALASQSSATVNTPREKLVAVAMAPESKSADTASVQRIVCPYCSAKLKLEGSLQGTEECPKCSATIDLKSCKSWS